MKTIKAITDKLVTVALYTFDLAMNVWLFVRCLK